MSGPLIAVTGATGAIGSKLLRMLLTDGFRVRALSRRRPEVSAPQFDWNPYTLSDPPPLTAEKLHGADHVIHLATIIPGKMPGNDSDHCYWSGNVLGTQRLIEAMSLAKRGRLILTGTANVYDPGQKEAKEDSPFGPQTRVLYLASKAAQEWLAASMCKAGNIDYAIMRISSVIGDDRSIIDRLAHDLAAGKSVRIEDGAAFGADFVDCNDVCLGLKLAIDLQLNGIFNLSSGERVELIDAVMALAQRLNRPSTAIEMVHVDHAPDTGFPAINCDKLQNFGFAPKPTGDVLNRIADRAQMQAAGT